MARTRRTAGLESTSSGDPQEEEEEEVDRISILPDALIHHILSFIDTKYAVQTSVLSKRWIRIWKSLPFLNFSRNSFFEGPARFNDRRFTNFVDMLLLFRDDCDIQKLFVDWENSAHEKRVVGYVNRWMLAAVKRNVQEITVDIGKNDHMVYEIPHQLFNCKSLRKLIMRRCVGGKNADINLPESMCLPKLELLCLSGFSISNVELTEKLFSSCPVLNSLAISNFEHSLIVNSTSLEILCLYGSGHVESTDQNVAASITKLSAPNLKGFICSGLMAQEYSFGNFSSLVSASILMTLKKESKDEILDTYSKLAAEEKEVYGKSMMKFLVAVQNVGYLGLSLGFLEVLSRAPNLLDCQLPHFCNLKYLVLNMWFTRDSLRSVAYLLMISPIVKSVLITSMESDSGDIENDWEAGLSSPGMLSCLKTFEMKEVVGCQSELKLLGFLLKHAMVLEEVALFFRSSVGSPDRVKQVKQFRDGLRAFPTASSNIKLMLF